MTKLDYCRKAYNYHQQGFNCAQSVLAAYTDRTGMSEEQSLAVATGFGGGIRYGGLCGAIGGAIMALGLICPQATGDAEAKRLGIQRTKEIERRFQEHFSRLDCRDLLAIKDLPTTEMVEELGAYKHCDLLIVAAADFLYDYLEELREKE